LALEELETRARVSATCSLTYSISTSTATTLDAISNCSTKFPNLAVSVTSARFGLTLEQPIVTQWKSGGKGSQLGLRLLVLALTSPQMEFQSIVSYSLETAEIWPECRFWDPGLAQFRELSIIRWFVHSLTAFHWDPGLAMGLREMVVTQSVTNFHYATFHWLAKIWVLQPKCGGADTLAYTVCSESEDLAGALLQSVDSIISLVDVSCTAACSMLTGVQMQSIHIIHPHVGIHCSDTCQIAAKLVHSLDVDSIISILQVVSRVVDQLVAVGIDIFNASSSQNCRVSGIATCPMLKCVQWQSDASIFSIVEVYITYLLAARVEIVGRQTHNGVGAGAAIDNWGRILNLLWLESYRVPGMVTVISVLMVHAHRGSSDFMSIRDTNTIAMQCISGVMLVCTTSSVGQILFSEFIRILLQVPWSIGCYVQTLVADQGLNIYHVEHVTALVLAGGTCLGLIARIVDDAIVPLVMPFIKANTTKPDWHCQEAATFAFGSILEGPSVEKLTPLVQSGLLVEIFELGNFHVDKRMETGQWTSLQKNIECLMLPYALLHALVAFFSKSSLVCMVCKATTTQSVLLGAAKLRSSFHLLNPGWCT
jgi:hypothetical protein